MAVQTFPLRKQRAGLVAGAFLFVLFAAWLMFDFARTLAYSLQSWGIGALLLDGVIHFRLGEILVLLPLAAALLVLDPDRLVEDAPARALRRANRAGVILCAISLITTFRRIEWSLLAGVIALVGLAAAVPVKRTGRGRKLKAWMVLIVLLLLHLLVLAGGFILHGYAVVPYPAPYPVPTFDRNARWQQDARYLGSELARLHANAYHTLSPQAYWQNIHRLEAAIPELTDTQAAVRMMGMVASVGDAHTQLRIETGMKLTHYPLELRWFSDGLYVTAIADAQEDALRARVIRLGNLEPEAAFQAMLPLLSHENEGWARLQSEPYLRIAEMLHAIGALESAGPLPLVVEGVDGQPFTVVLDPITKGQPVKLRKALEEHALFYQSRSDWFWYDYREQTRTLYFRYVVCMDPAGFGRTVQEFWQTADQYPVDRVILDLRGNNGGNTLQFDSAFLPELLKRPAYNQPDRLFVLVDSGTFSSGADAAVMMRKHTRATIVGQPTGGSPNGYGDVRMFRLPNSGMVVAFSTRYFEPQPGAPSALVPDLPVPVRAEDIFAGRDAILEQVAPGETW